MPRVAVVQSPVHAEAVAPRAPVSPRSPERSQASSSPERRRISGGPALAALEESLAARFTAPVEAMAVAGVGHGLTLALRALSVQPGWVCAVPAWAGERAAEAATAAGLTPWRLAVIALDGQLSPEAVHAALPRAPGPVAVVMPASVGGRSPDFAGWAAFRESTAVPVLIDAVDAFDTLARAPLPVVAGLPSGADRGYGAAFLATEDTHLAHRVRALIAAEPSVRLGEGDAAAGRGAVEAWPARRLRCLRAAQLLRIALAEVPEVSFQPGWGTEWASETCVVRLGAERSADTRLLRLPFSAEMTLDEIEQTARGLLPALETHPI